MIVAEIKNPEVMIRIHDDFFEEAHHVRMTNISKIVADSYKRRQAENEMKQAVSIDSRTSV